jgi:heme exporter protein D
MIWESWSAFFDMGGYGLYVWGSVIMTFALLFGEIYSLTMRWNSGIRDLGNWLDSEDKDDAENKV